MRSELAITLKNGKVVTEKFETEEKANEELERVHRALAFGKKEDFAVMVGKTSFAKTEYVSATLRDPSEFDGASMGSDDE